MPTQHDLVVIGGGPGGYIAAIRAAQLGLNVACIEKEPALGGTCLRVGCIPSKAMLESSELYAQARHGLARHGIQVEGARLDLATMLKRKDQVVSASVKGIDYLFKKNKVTRYLGHGRFTGPGQVTVDREGAEPLPLAARHVIIATGSEVARLRGVELDWDLIGGSTEALAYPEVPAHLVVIGAGVIGLELGSVWSRLGARVTVLEYQDRILPGVDGEIAAETRKILEKQGLVFRLGVKVTGARVVGPGQCRVEVEGGEPELCDRVLLAVGRSPNTAGLGLETVGVALDARGRVEVTDHFATSAPGIFAIGDVIRGPMLAHKAEEEGVACVERIVTGHGHVNYDAIPGIVYTHPEVAGVGKTEEELIAAGASYKKGVAPFSANGRARALGSIEGRVKLLADARTDRLLGAHIVGPRAGDLIAELAVAIEFGASAEDVARACHAHPTLAEVIKEAALAVDGRPLNF